MFGRNGYGASARSLGLCSTLGGVAQAPATNKADK